MYVRYYLRGKAILDRIRNGFDGNWALQRVLGAINYLPIPFHLMPLHIGGHILYANRLDRFLALLLYKASLFESDEFQLLRKLCCSGMTVIDIGANIGIHTVELANLVGPTGRVISYEPEMSNFETLCRNIAANNYFFVTPVRSAVGNRVGSASLYISRSHSGDHRVTSTSVVRERKQVPMVSLDSSLPVDTAVHLVKIDVQGAEGLVLQGMRRILTTNPGLCVIFEFWPIGLIQFGFKPDEVLADLLALGYRIYQIDKRFNFEVRISTPLEFLNTLKPGQYINLLARAPSAP